MAPCLVLIALLLLHGLEVTLQFPSLPGNLETTNDLAGCTVQLIREFQSDADTLRIYGSTVSTSPVSEIIRKNVFEHNHLIPVISTSYSGTEESQLMVPEKICLSIVSASNELVHIVQKLYHKLHHTRAIVCLTYINLNPLRHLLDVTSKIWTKGIPRNVIFIVSNYHDPAISIIGVPGYAKENCRQIKLKHVGQYRDGSLMRLGPGFYSRVDELGGCELSVMVQPPFLPYVERKADRHPGGMVGELMGMLANSMNFTLKYVWSSTYEGMMEHLAQSDLNVFIDMMPRASTPATNYRFSVGMTKVTFIVPQRGERGSMLGRLLIPFDSSVWLGILAVLVGLMGVSSLARNRDFGNVLLKTFGSLLGVGVGGYPNFTWIKIFLCYWLLPSYVLIQAYLACLTKQFTIPPSISFDIATMNDLINSNLDVLCGPGTKHGICSIQEVGMKALCQKCRLVNDETIWDEFYPKLLKTGMMNDTAVISNLDYLNAHPAFLRVHAINDKLTNVNQLVEVRPGGNYIFVMKRLFERLFASGLIQFWRRLYSNTEQRPIVADSSAFLQREFAKCSFRLLIAGLSISFVCFIAEIVMHHLINKK